MTDNLQKQPDTKKAGSRTKTENQVKLIETLRKLGIEKDRAKRLEQLQTYKKSLAERTKEKEKSKQPKDQSESKKEGKSNQSKDQGESKGFPATQDKLLSSPRYSFPASLPVQIEPDALEIIEKWYEKRKGKTDTTKPPSKAKRSKSQKDKTESKADKKRDVGPNLEKKRRYGVKLRKAKDEEKIEVVIDYPTTPAAMTSPLTKNQGEYNYQLRY